MQGAKNDLHNYDFHQNPMGILSSWRDVLKRSRNKSGFKIGGKHEREAFKTYYTHNFIGVK